MYRFRKKSRKAPEKRAAPPTTRSGPHVHFYSDGTEPQAPWGDPKVRVCANQEKFIPSRWDPQPQPMDMDGGASPAGRTTRLRSSDLLRPVDSAVSRPSSLRTLAVAPTLSSTGSFGYLLTRVEAHDEPAQSPAPTAETDSMKEVEPCRNAFDSDREDAVRELCRADRRKSWTQAPFVPRAIRRWSEGRRRGKIERRMVSESKERVALE